MIKTLTSWRGIFVLIVVLCHFGKLDGALSLMAVTFFFVLSGFLVTFKRGSMPVGFSFVKHRFLRLYPLHWLSLALLLVTDVAIVHKFHYDWQLPVHVLLLQPWVPRSDVFYNFSTHSWFLGSLFAAALATPLLLRLARRLSLKVLWVIVALACAVVVWLYGIATGEWLNYLRVCPAVRLVDYSLGLVLGLSCRSLRAAHDPRRLSMAWRTAIEIAVMTFCVVVAAVTVSAGDAALQVNAAPVWWIPVMALIAAMALLGGEEGLPGRLLLWRPLVWLGCISFEVYIMQTWVNAVYCYGLSSLFGHFGIHIYDYSFEVGVPLLIVVAWLVNRYFTRPFTRRA